MGENLSNPAHANAANAHNMDSANIKRDGIGTHLVGSFVEGQNDA
jgi:hypothetical protein